MDKPSGYQYKIRYVMYILATILALVFALMQFLGADNEPREVKGVFDPVAEEFRADVLHYNVYWWQGSDTTEWSLANMTKLEEIPNAPADSFVTQPLLFSLNYVRAGATAVYAHGESDLGACLSRFYAYSEFFAVAPTNMRVTD